MSLNTTILDLDLLCAVLSHAEVWDICNDLKDSKEELLILQNAPIHEDEDMEEYLDFCMSIEEQLVFLDKNIKTLEVALLCHEGRVSEKRIALGAHQTFWLN